MNNVCLNFLHFDTFREFKTSIKYIFTLQSFMLFILNNICEKKMRYASIIHIPKQH